MPSNPSRYRRGGPTPESFVADVRQWRLDTEAKMSALVRLSTQDVIRDAQKPGPSKANPTASGGGRMPIDTGFLRNSIVVLINIAQLPPLIGRKLSRAAKIAAGRSDQTYGLKVSKIEGGATSSP